MSYLLSAGDEQVSLLVAKHLDLAEDLARQHFNRPGRRQWLDQAVGVAADALLRAARRWRPERGPFAVRPGLAARGVPWESLPFVGWAEAEVREKLRKLLKTLRRRQAARPRTVPLLDRPDHELAARPVVPESLPLDVAELLDRLTPAQRDVVTRRVQLGQSFAEIGWATHRTREAVRRTFDRAVATLRVVLSPAG